MSDEEEVSAEEIEEEISTHPVHRILITKSSTTGSIQLMVQTSASLAECRKHFDEIMEKHDMEKKK